MKVTSGPRLLTRDIDSRFAQIPGPEIPRSVFDRSHGYKSAIDAGYLYPIYADEVLPGDTFTMKTTTFARMATPIVPLMDNMYADIHFWFVPNRLIWENWERFNGSQDNPDDSTDFLMPVVTYADPIPTGDFGDFLGLPVGKDNVSVRADWHRAYYLIYNEWYRDQNLQDSVDVPLDDGPDVGEDYELLRRGRRHDYFTSALPWPQKGPSVPLLAGTAPVSGIGMITQNYDTGPVNVYETGQVATVAYAKDKLVTNNTASNDQHFYIEEDPDNPGFPNIRANLNDDATQTINSLRESFQLQRMLERDARGGTRYTEILRSHFGVISPDFRLQRPEFLGGGTTMINISPIPQTGATGATGTPQGNLAANGTFSHHGVGFHKGFVEHGVILGLISIRSDYSYQQGINRMFSRSTRYDFYWPALSHLGEQAILNKEIYYQNVPGEGASQDDGVFGYQERYAEYRYKPSVITGQMRSTATTGTPLDTWHLAQEFGSLPTLGADFIVEDPPVDRVIAVPSEPQFILDVAFRLKCARPMPVYSVPGLIDHF